jgi:hypothetical protein
MKEYPQNVQLLHLKARISLAHKVVPLVYSKPLIFVINKLTLIVAQSHQSKDFVHRFGDFVKDQTHIASCVDKL